MGEYHIRKGDNLTKLARQFNTTVAKLVELNSLDDPNKIIAGKTLIVPDQVEAAKNISPQAESARQVSPLTKSDHAQETASAAAPPEGHPLNSGPQNHHGHHARAHKGVPEVSDSVRTMVIEKAAHYVGVMETGGDNKGSAVRDFLRKSDPQGASWCAGFVSHVLGEVAPGALDYSLVAKNLMRQAMHENAYHQVGSYTPQVGDLIFFSRGQKGWQGHVGFVERVEADGTIYTIEGNKAHPDFKGQEDHPYDAARPDGVRRVAYAPHETEESRILGFADLSVIARNVAEDPRRDQVASLAPQDIQPPRRPM